MRKRFTSAECEQFTIGTPIEWRNGNKWHPGTVAAAFDRDSLGMARVKLTNHAKTRTVSPDDVIYGYPGTVRLPNHGGTIRV